MNILGKASQTPNIRNAPLISVELLTLPLAIHLTNVHVHLNINFCLGEGYKLNVLQFIPPLFLFCH